MTVKSVAALVFAAGVATGAAGTAVTMRTVLPSAEPPSDSRMP